MKTAHFWPLLAVLAFLPGIVQADENSTHVQMDDKANSTVLYLGKIGVTGHQAITETLQAIKLSLKQPYSNDPALADTLVCRLEPVPGSNTRLWLTCGTNRVLTLQRNVLRTTLTAAAFSDPSHTKSRDGEPGPGSVMCAAECFATQLDTLSQVVQMQPGKYLHVQVNGSALRGLLDSLPEPAPQALPAAATVIAPAAATAHL